MLRKVLFSYQGDDVRKPDWLYISTTYHIFRLNDLSDINNNSLYLHNLLVFSQNKYFRNFF
jgi:hypothetical protein